MGLKVGGVETFIKGFIKYAPANLDIELVGITSSMSERPPNVWIPLKIGSKEFNFYPVLHENNENRKTIVPLSLRFTAALIKEHLELPQRILIFNRLEPAVAFLRTDHQKIGFVHNDIQKQMMKDSDSFWKYAPWLYFFIEKRIMGSLDLLYTVNTQALDFYKQRYPEISSRISFLPTWVDQEVFYVTDESKKSIRRELTTTSKIPLDLTWILFVGRLQEQKAPLRLIQSFLDYLRLNENSCLLILGEGNLQEKMMLRARHLGIDSSIHFLGFKTQRELSRFYQASDVLVLTSNYEGMPRSCLEALGSGLPVVSTDVGEVHRVVRNAFSGEIVDDFSPLSIARAINKIAQTPHNYEKENCLESVAEYTPKKVLAKVYELLDNLSKWLPA